MNKKESETAYGETGCIFPEGKEAQTMAGNEISGDSKLSPLERELYKNNNVKYRYGTHGCW